MTDVKMMTVLVCGGRDYTDYARMKKLLDFNRAKIGMIVMGGAPGADTFAGTWAWENQVACLCIPAEWAKFGKKAGFIRNEKMLSIGKPDLVVAFPGGVGTAMMVRLAKQAGVRVIEVPDAEMQQAAADQANTMGATPGNCVVAAKKAAPTRPLKAGKPAIQPSRDQLIDRNIAAGLELGAIPI
jgi:hypothetical protein